MMLRATLLAAATLLGACATDETTMGDAGERDCFRAEAVNGYSIVDDHNIRVNVSANRHYILNTMWNANDLDWTQAIVLRAPTGWICTGRTPGLEVVGGHLAQTYPIHSVSRDLTDHAPVGS